MTVGDICKRNVVVAPKGETIVDAAKRMRFSHVGNVVVVEYRDGKPFPIGILTDRDIVLSTVASNSDQLPYLMVGEAMTDDVVTAREDTSVDDALSVMQQRGVRRLPVVDASGALVGIISVDDVIRHLADELNGLVKLMSREQQLEHQFRA
jgi:CBS domain-containing protein